jgi:hypothetical protein
VKRIVFIRNLREKSLSRKLSCTEEEYAENSDYANTASTVGTPIIKISSPSLS